ncbi:hypothetical protein CK247_30160, partial [Klebsiella pneumoniae]
MSQQDAAKQQANTRNNIAWFHFYRRGDSLVGVLVILYAANNYHHFISGVVMSQQDAAKQQANTRNNIAWF